MSEPTATAPAWAVTAQQETTNVGPTGSFEQGVNVSFTTAKGVSGTVFVPNNQYNKDNVKKAIMGYVAHLDAVADLTSDS